MAKSSQGVKVRALRTEVKKLGTEVEKQRAIIKRLYYYVGGLLALGIGAIVVPLVLF
ncbi:MAG: hypothetical protein GY800_11955 [Planctomycetes bacterium]|nr:hypothetical protein [Planctomycetota bacterium]